MSTARQLSFSGGELSPSLYARVDQVKYQTGLKTLRNFYILKSGGIANRPGTTFIGEVKDSSAVVRLIEFIFNEDQTYILEFGNLYLRVIHDGAYVTDLDLTITDITNADPAVLTYTGTDPSNGDEFAISGVVGMTEVNGRNFKVANVNTGANTFELDYLDGDNVDSTSFGTYSSGGSASRIYTLTTPYETANLFELRYVQSEDVITISHTSYDPRELTRSAHNVWTLTAITFAPSISAPTGLSGPGGSTLSYKVTTIKDETFEESTASSALSCGGAEPTVDVPVDISWTQVSGARQYAIYRSFYNNAIWGLVGFAGDESTPEFRDIGVTPDTTDTPPDARNPFSGASNRPLCVGYFQQRLAFANTTNNTQKLDASRVGFFKNFTISTPVQEDDAINFTLDGRQVNQILHIIDLKRPILFTSTGEFALYGDSSGIVTPFAVNVRQQGYNGCSSVPPLIISDTALFIQSRGAIVRDLNFDYTTEGYSGKDLTVFSSHLFEGYELTDWAYTKTPNSIIWAVRDDGVLLSLTYVREHELWGWARHDTDGEVESVAAIPEGLEDSLYMVVKRTIDGETKRYVEKMGSRFIDDIVDNIFMDCALSYDGRNTAATTMTLSGGTNWTYDETLTLTASASHFASTDVGDQIHITGTDGTIIRFTIDAYSGVTVVTGRSNQTVPAAMRSAALTTWSHALNTVTGLWHLEGESVSILGDGFVMANPNNASHEVVTVTNGTATFDTHAAVIHIGLPYIPDIETLNIDRVDNETLMDKKKLITKVNMIVEKSRGIWVGGKPPTDDDDDPLENLVELKRRNEEDYDSPVDLVTDTVEIRIVNTWNSNGRVFVRQIDPVPLTILGIAPSGMIATR